MEKFTEEYSSPKIESSKDESYELLTETKKEILALSKNCDNSSLFLKEISQKIEKIEDLNTLSELKLNLERITAGILSLSSGELSGTSDASDVSEKTKAIELLISGWFFIKNTLQISSPANIKKTIALINNRHAN